MSFPSTLVLDKAMGLRPQGWAIQSLCMDVWSLPCIHFCDDELYHDPELATGHWR